MNWIPGAGGDGEGEEGSGGGGEGGGEGGAGVQFNTLKKRNTTIDNSHEVIIGNRNKIRSLLYVSFSSI